jgi:branched-chain amino acid transport system ATP-binding protein
LNLCSESIPERPKNETLKLIHRIHDRKVSILSGEQNARKALQVAQRGFVLENGKIVIGRTALDLLENPGGRKRTWEIFQE